MPQLFPSSGVIVTIASVVLLGYQAHAPSTPLQGRPFRVVTYNIHAGVDEKGRYDLQQTMRAIAGTKADLVGLQEVVRNHIHHNCDDQPALLAEGLTRATGKPWTQVYVNEWVTKHRECVDSGRGDGVETEGLAFLAPEPFAKVDHVKLWNSRIGLLARLESAPDVDVVVTHLAAQLANQKDRVRQVDGLLPWAVANGARILMGDLNADADAPELRPLLARYRDAWPEAAGQSSAAGGRSGGTRTHGDSRIDYVLYAPDKNLRLESVDVVDTGSLLGAEASDHRPVVATFRISPASQKIGTTTVNPREAR